MEVNLKHEGVVKFKKGEIIFREGSKASSIGLIIQGRLLIISKEIKIAATSGHFIALNDLFIGEYLSSYIALEDIAIYIFNVDNFEDLTRIYNFNKDYNGLMIASLSYNISELNKTFQGIYSIASRLKKSINEKSSEYIAMCMRLSYPVEKINDSINNLANVDEEIVLENDRIEFYEEYRNIPVEAIKEFFSYSNILTLNKVRNQVDIFNSLIEQIETLSMITKSYIHVLADINSNSLFMNLASLAEKIKEEKGENHIVLDLLDDIICAVNEVESFYKKRIGSIFDNKLDRMTEIYSVLTQDTDGNVDNPRIYLKYPIEETKQAQEEMEDSLNKILSFSGVSKDVSDDTRALVLDFINIRDKYGTDDRSRKLRKDISKNFYIIYKKVLLKSLKLEEIPRIIILFLEFGFIDERLLTQEERMDLYFLKDAKLNHPCRIYSIREWLFEIYKGNKEPSKNEFDLDYSQMLLEKKKSGKVSDEEIQKLSKDKYKKLEYEIDNMFKTCNRIVTGHPASFVPILHSDTFIGNIKNTYITSKKINDLINRLLKIDFSIFIKETLYANEKENINKEIIIEEVYPDIILMPTFGDNPMMWQDISGRKRNTPGRFVFPSFTTNDLERIMVKTFARFRWEACRTIQGIYWNDFKHKSLTSEYSDYIQFYRKNSDLSVEQKDKLRLQIKKGRNNTREIFVIDYENWILGEAQGVVRLNKIVREIMATYCPFDKSIRDKIIQQPMFEVIINKYERKRLKKVRELEGRYRNLERENIKVPQELIDTLRYYQER